MSIFSSRVSRVVLAAGTAWIVAGCGSGNSAEHIRPRLPEPRHRFAATIKRHFEATATSARALNRALKPYKYGKQGAPGELDRALDEIEKQAAAAARDVKQLKTPSGLADDEYHAAAVEYFDFFNTLMVAKGREAVELAQSGKTDTLTRLRIMGCLGRAEKKREPIARKLIAASTRFHRELGAE